MTEQKGIFFPSKNLVSKRYSDRRRKDNASGHCRKCFEYENNRELGRMP
jgi:hypothetical protein